MTESERIDSELAAMQTRIADDGTRLVELESEIARLNRIVELLTDSQDVIATGLERHQAHHEAVEELLDKPITRAVVQRMLIDVEQRDRAQHKDEREARSRVIETVDDE